MPNEIASPLELMASVTHTSADDWEPLDGPDSGIGVDYWYRHRGTGKEAYLNLDQDHLTISFDGEQVYNAEAQAMSVNEEVQKIFQEDVDRRVALQLGQVTKEVRDAPGKGALNEAKGSAKPAA